MSSPRKPSAFTITTSDYLHRMMSSQSRRDGLQFLIGVSYSLYGASGCLRSLRWTFGPSHRIYKSGIQDPSINGSRTSKARMFQESRLDLNLVVSDFTKTQPILECGQRAMTGSPIKALFWVSMIPCSLSIVISRTGLSATRLSRPLLDGDLTSKGDEVTHYDCEYLLGS